MTRTSHKSHQTPAFPVSCLGFTDDATVILGGGGGSSRTGIQNKLKVCSISKNGREFKEISHYTFEPGEDAPTSLAIDIARKQVVVGVNASEHAIRTASHGDQGNNHCRTYSYVEQRLEAVRAAQTIDAPWSDDYPYQSHTRINPTGSLIAVATISAGTGVSAVSVMDAETLRPIWSWDSQGEGIEGDLVDVDFSLDCELIAITTSRAIHVHNISSLPVSAEGEAVKRLAVIEAPTGLTQHPVSFRAAKFSRISEHPATIHAIVNATPKPMSRTKTTGKRSPTMGQKGYCCNFIRKAGVVDAWEVKTKQDLGNKPISAFEVSANGDLLAYASSDYTIGLLDARTLAPLLKILHTHSFAIRALAFNPSASLLVSAGADNSIRVVVVPSSFGSSATTIGLLLLVFLAVLAIALYHR